MNFLESIPIIGKIFDRTANIIQEAVLDKDKANEILENLDTIRMTVEKEVYVKELETKTVPWIDGLHKLGRQILNLLVIIAVCLLMLSGKTITPEVALILGGGNIAYQFVKGKGK